MLRAKLFGWLVVTMTFLSCSILSGLLVLSRFVFFLLRILTFFMFCGFCHDLRQYFGMVVGFVGRAVPLLGGAVAGFIAGLRQHKPLIFT